MTYGGVLLKYNPTNFLESLNISKGKQKILNHLIFKNEKWRDCLNGKISLDFLIQDLSEKNKEYTKEIHEILGYHNMKNIMPPKLEVIEYMKTLKEEGNPIYLLSNLTADTYTYINEEYDIVDIVEGGIYSFLEGVCKPDPKIYKALINKFSIHPEESIFIDDTKRNIEIANELGFKGILYTTLEDVKNQIKNIRRK